MRTLIRRRRVARTWLVLGGLLAATGCAGPSTPINASLKAFPQNVRIGAAIIKAPPIAPLPPSAPQFTGGFVAPPRGDVPRPIATSTTPSAQLVTATPVASCMKAGPGVTPLLAAGPAVEGRPAPSTYAYRTSGKHSVGGAQATTVDYPEHGTRVVSPSRDDTDAAGALKAFSYDVTVTLGKNRTVTTYRSVTVGSSVSQPVTRDPGLYVTEMKTLDERGLAQSSFKPQPAMMVLPYPADQGTEFTVSSVDAASGITVAYRGEVGPHVVVDACGKVVDTRSVTHTGTISVGSCGSTSCAGGEVEPGDTTSFVGTYDIATQYGGLSVQDQVHVEGVGLDAPFTDDLTGVISSVPLVPVP